jgi:hypothetical protein
MNAWFLGGKNALLTKQIHFVSDDVQVQIIDAAVWSPTAATGADNNHFVAQLYSAIPAGAKVGPAVSLPSKSVSGRNFLTDNITVPGVSGSPSEWLIFFHVSTSICLFGYDQASNAGLPVIPNDLDIVIEVPADKVLFRL